MTKVMMMLAALAVGTLAAFPAAVRAQEPLPDIPGAEFDCSPLQFLQSRPELSYLAAYFAIDAENYPELYGAPPNASFPYTFFAPSNDAFENFWNLPFFDPPLTFETSFLPESEEDYPGFNSFLFYHFVPGLAISSTDLPGLTATVPTGAALFAAVPDPTANISVVDGVITPEVRAPPPTRTCDAPRLAPPRARVRADARVTHAARAWG